MTAAYIRGKNDKIPKFFFRGQRKERREGGIDAEWTSRKGSLQVFPAVEIFNEATTRRA